MTRARPETMAARCVLKRMQASVARSADWLAACRLEARMCDLCDDLDYQIERCRRLEGATTDELMREAIAALIKSYEEDKAKLHPNQCSEA